MTLFDWVSLISLHLYVVTSVCCLTAFFVHRKWLQSLALWLACSTFVLHTFTLIQPLLYGKPHRGIFIMAFAWCIAVIAVLFWRILRQPTFVLLAMPIVTLVFLFSLLRSGVPLALPPMLSGMFFSIHVLALSLAFALMVVGFLAALLFLAQERRLKKKHLVLRFFKDLPSLTLLDRINAFTIYVGFPLFSMGLFGGFINTHLVYAEFFTGDPKEWVSVAIWCLYAYYFIGRVTSRISGKRAAFLALSLFVLCVGSLTVVSMLFATYHTLMGPLYVP